MMRVIDKFVNYFIDDRVKAKMEGDTGRAAFDKNILNSSYGADGQNNEKFSNIKFCDRNKTLKAHAAGNFKHTHKVTDDLYIVEKEALTPSCKKPIQSSCATLSNAKYWYTLFVYKFMYKCMDKNRFHFVYTDTDSYMWAIAGTGKRRKTLEYMLGDKLFNGLNEMRVKKVPLPGFVQPFEDIITDHEFYNKWYPLFFPKKKTLLSLEYEHCCLNMVALAPKNYYTDDGEGDIVVKQKGVTLTEYVNTNINKDAMDKCLKEGKMEEAESHVLRTENTHMTMQINRKNGISGVNTKSVVLERGACLPFIYGVPSSCYHTN
jgi:hypothetical protein